MRRLCWERVFYAKKSNDVINHTYAILLQKGIPYTPGILTRKSRRETLRTHGIPEVDRGLDVLNRLDETSKELDVALKRAPASRRKPNSWSRFPAWG